MSTTNNSGNGVSRYLRLYRVLSQALAEGRIAPGTALPSEPKLVREYGISRTTVRNALSRLETEGRIVRRRGSGTYASDGGKRSVAPHECSRGADEAQQLASRSTVRQVVFTRVATPEFLLREWPEFGQIALLIRRVRSVRAGPLVLETSYVPAHIGSRLTPHSLDSASVVEALAAAGQAPGSWEREFAAVPADPTAATSLDLAVGTPVLAVTTVARDSRRRILEYSRFIYRPDRYEARFPVGRSGVAGRDRSAARR